MLFYLRLAWEKRLQSGGITSAEDAEGANVEGAARRLRPKLMTVVTDMIGFIQVFIVGGLGSDVMRCIVAPMVGGLLVSSAVELLVHPAVFAIWRGRGARGCAPRRPTPAG